jgi:uncharacterized protein YjbJ (UPF0337 family)
MNEFQKEGAKEQVGGKMDNLKGKIKEGAGKLTGDRDLEAEGEVDQAKGNIRDNMGRGARKLGDAAEDVKDAFKGKK